MAVQTATTTAPAAPAKPVTVQAVPAPVKTQATTATPAPAPAAVQPSLVGQLQSVDPLVYTALAGALVVPFLHQGIKNLITSLHDPKHRLRNYLIAGLLNLLVGLLFEIQNSGTLSHLHNPALATILAAALSYTLGQNVYGFFVKTNEQNGGDPATDPNAAPEDASLPAITNP